MSSGCWQDLAGVFFLLATLSILFNDRTDPLSTRIFFGAVSLGGTASRMRLRVPRTVVKGWNEND